MDVIYSNKSSIGSKPITVVEPAFEIAELEVKSETAVANGKMLQPYDEAGGGFISFHNISYTVEQRKCFRKRPPKVILNNVRYVRYCVTIDDLIIIS